MVSVSDSEHVLKKGRPAWPHPGFGAAALERSPGTGWLGNHVFVRNAAYKKKWNLGALQCSSLHANRKCAGQASC
jgi:hypothetical protein